VPWHNIILLLHFSLFFR